MRYIMIGTLITTLLISIYFFKDYYNKKICFSEYIATILVGFTIGFFLNFLLMIIIYMGIDSYASKKDVIDSVVNIRAIDNKQSTTGNFFLGSGSINGRMYYYYMTTEKDGSTQIKKIENDDSVYIIETNSENPKIVFYKKEFVNSKFKNLECRAFDRTKTKIYIPKGSLKTNYNIDLK